MTLALFAAIHFLAASSGFIFLPAIMTATAFWSCAVQLNFLITLTAGEPDFANFVEMTLRRSYDGYAQLAALARHVAVRRAGRQHDLAQLELGVQPLRGVPVEEDRLLLGIGLLDLRDLRGLATGVHDLEIQLQVVDQRLVRRDVRRIAVEQLALAAGLGGLEQRPVLLQALPGLHM